ncbi:MAG: ABC transporter substrate-binding protein [Clostridia bacterium]|nr:ABC transporter substrate-binding protein [Clostridia bacterium]
MKKIFSIVLAVAMLATALFMFAGCGEKKVTNEIVVGMIGPYTGGTAQYGLAVQNGAKLYFDEVNAAGGVNGFKIKVVAYDSKGEDAEANTAFSRLVDEGMSAFLGEVLTGTTLAIVPDAFEKQIPMVTASATADAVTVNPDTGAVYNNVFRTCFIDSFQGIKMAQYAKEKLGAKTAAVIYQTGDDYAEGLAKSFVEECGKIGIDVVAEAAYAKGDVDFKSQLTNFVSKNPDVVFCPNYYQDDGMIITQARQVGLTCKFLGGDGWGNVTKYASAEDLNGCLYASAFDESDEKVKEFKAKYIEKFGADAPFNMFSALAYDAAKVIVNALQKATAVTPDNVKAGYFTSDAYKADVINAIKTQSGSIDGLTTNGYSFDEKNNPIKSITIVECVNGEEVSRGLY